MKILISGHKGFVGRNLVKSLSCFTLYGLSRSLQESAPYLKKEISWESLSPAFMDDLDVVIHLAGKAHDLKNNSVVEEYVEVNTGLTQKLFDLFLKSSAKEFIYFSSVKAVADSVEGVLNETVKAAPKTAYGFSKFKAEEYLLGKILPQGKRLFILRPCMIHGPGNKGNLNLLYKVVKMRIPYPLAAFENRRSFLSILNLNFIVKRLLDDPAIPGGIYHLADDEALSTNEVVKIIGMAANIKSRLWPISPFFINKMAVLGDLLPLPLNSERLKKLTESYIVDNAKIKKALNIAKLPISSRDGLFATINSFQS